MLFWERVLYARQSSCKGTPVLFPDNQSLLKNLGEKADFPAYIFSITNKGTPPVAFRLGNLRCLAALITNDAKYRLA